MNGSFPETGNNLILREEIKDPSFNEDSRAAYTLNLLITADRVELAVINEGGNAIMLQSYDLQGMSADAFIVNELPPWAKPGFSKINIGYLSEHYTLIPAEINLSDPKKLLNIQDEILADEEIILDEGTNNFYIAFAIPGKLLKAINSSFPDSTINHGLSGALRNEMEGTGIRVIIESNKAHIGTFKSGKTVLVNQYGFNNAEDLLYFLLEITESHNFDRRSLPLSVSGHIVPDTPTMRQVNRYFGNITYASPDEVTGKKGFAASHPHMHLPVYSLHKS